VKEWGGKRRRYPSCPEKREKQKAEAGAETPMWAYIKQTWASKGNPFREGGEAGN